MLSRVYDFFLYGNNKVPCPEVRHKKKQKQNKYKNEWKYNKEKENYKITENTRSLSRDTITQWVNSVVNERKCDYDEEQGDFNYWMSKSSVFYEWKPRWNLITA